MPSRNKRVNLTVPDHLYKELQQYKEDHGILNDAAACLQLMVQRLHSLYQHSAT